MVAGERLGIPSNTGAHGSHPDRARGFPLRLWPRPCGKSRTCVKALLCKADGARIRRAHTIVVPAPLFDNRRTVAAVWVNVQGLLLP